MRLHNEIRGAERRVQLETFPSAVVFILLARHTYRVRLTGLSLGSPSARAVVGDGEMPEIMFGGVPPSDDVGSLQPAEIVGVLGLSVAVADHGQLGALMSAQASKGTHRIRQEVFNLLLHGASLDKQIGDVPTSLRWHLRIANLGGPFLGTSFHLANASFHELSASRLGWIK